MSNGMDRVTGGVGIKHGAGMLAAQPGQRGLRLHDLAQEDSPSVYVRTRASKITKKVTHVLVPHKSSQSGDVFSMEIPNTFIPIDMAQFAPKEELLKNTLLMNLVNAGVLELISTDDAEAELSKPESQKEQSRLMALKMQRLQGIGEPGTEGTEDGQMRATLGINAKLDQGAPGQIDAATVGVSAPVAQLFGALDLTDEDRAVMLRSIVDTLTDKDRQYIRGRTDDARIRELIG